MSSTLVTHHRLRPLIVPIAMRLHGVENSTHRLLLLRRKLNLPRSEVLFQAPRLRSTWDWDHALLSYPSQSDLGQSAALTLSKLLNFLDDSLVVVEVLALKLRD